MLRRALVHDDIGVTHGSLLNLEFHPQKKQKINPQHVHEMPVVSGRIERAAPQYSMFEFGDHANQPTHTTGNVQSLGRGQNVEERAAGIVAR